MTDKMTDEKAIRVLREAADYRTATVHGSRFYGPVLSEALDHIAARLAQQGDAEPVGEVVDLDSREAVVSLHGSGQVAIGSILYTHPPKQAAPDNPLDLMPRCFVDLEGKIPAKEGDKVALVKGAIIGGADGRLFQADPSRRPTMRGGLPSFEQDSENDYGIANAVFNNRWDDVKGREVTCPMRTVET